MMSPPQQDMSKMQTCVLKVNIHCQGCKRKVIKILNKVQGVYGIDVDAEKGRVMVTGVAEPEMLINKLNKSGKPAELLEPVKGHQKSILLQSSDNGQKGQIIRSNIIQPGDDTNNVPIPKGLKVVKEVKVLADDKDDDQLKATDSFGTKDGGFVDDDADGLSVSKGKGREGGVGIGKSVKKGNPQDGKKGDHMENMKKASRLEAVLKNKFGNRMANDGIGDHGGGMSSFSDGHEAKGARPVQMDQMAQMPPVQVPVTNGGYYQANVPYDQQQQRQMAAAMMNHQPHPMTNNDMHYHSMRYSQADSSGRVPLPPPPAADPLAHIFNDENANGCIIM